MLRCWAFTWGTHNKLIAAAAKSDLIIHLTWVCSGRPPLLNFTRREDQRSAASDTDRARFGFCESHKATRAIPLYLPKNSSKLLFEWPRPSGIYFFPPHEMFRQQLCRD